MIERLPEKAAREPYDLIVVGGGIYGIMTALEAVRRNLSVLLLEKEDFGGGTTANSLRIIHGGLRDLQRLDLKRYWQFGQERHWFLSQFPSHVKQLPVLIPLYQQGLFRTEVFRCAFLIDRLLLPRKHRVEGQDVIVPPGRVLSSLEVRARFPLVSTDGLAGGALWYDATVPDVPRFLMALLSRVCNAGGTALNYVEVTDLLTRGNAVTGVQAFNHVGQQSYTYRAARVIVATGAANPPWMLADEFREGSHDSWLLGWNVLFDRPALSGSALGITSPIGSRHRYFLHPWKGRLLIGTGYRNRKTAAHTPEPSAHEVCRLITNVNRAVPGLALSMDEVLRVYSGFLPATEEGSRRLARRDDVIDYATAAGPQGLVALRGTKFTAARATAERAIAVAFPEQTSSAPYEEIIEASHSAVCPRRGVYDYDWMPEEGDTAWQDELAEIVAEESVQHLSDLVLRRTGLGDNPMRALRLAPTLCNLFDWDEGRRAQEVAALKANFPRVPQGEIMNSWPTQSAHNQENASEKHE